MDILRDWRKSREWCMERGIPWKMGLLLTGPPGNGKTAYIRGICADLGLPVNVFHLSTLTSYELGMFWESAVRDAPVAVVFEDIDNVFEGRQSKNESLSYDDFLNCLDGVDQHNGVLAFVTTNRPETIDEALAGKGSVTRPGRIDVSLVFNKPDREGRRKIAKRILCDFSEQDREAVVTAGANDSGAQFQNRCVNTARKRIRGEAIHAEVGKNGSSKENSDRVHCVSRS